MSIEHIEHGIIVNGDILPEADDYDAIESDREDVDTIAPVSDPESELLEQYKARLEKLADDIHDRNSGRITYEEALEQAEKFIGPVPNL